MSLPIESIFNTPHRWKIIIIINNKKTTNQTQDLNTWFIGGSWK